MLLIVWKVWGPPILLTTCWHTTDLTWHKQSDLLWSLHQLTEVTSMPPLLTSNIPATDWILTFSSQLIEILGYLYPGSQLVGGIDSLIHLFKRWDVMWVAVVVGLFLWSLWQNGKNVDDLETNRMTSKEGHHDDDVN